MRFLEYYEAYGHGNAPTAPIGDETNHIIGLELEVSHFNEIENLEEAIEEGVIETYDTAEAPIVLEEEAQGDVDYELIFKADNPADVLRRVEEIYTYIGTGDVCRTERNTSCHVHLNRYYVEEVLGLDQLDIWRAAEAIAPLIFKVSGRNYSSWNEWTPSRVDMDTDPLRRFQLIDDAEPRSSGEYRDRYELCNLTNDKTIEIRGFSNWFKFNPKFIGLYVRIVSELLPAIAEAMKGKTYARDGIKTVLPLVKDFLEDYPEIVSRFDLSFWYNIEETIKNETRRRFEEAINKYNRCNDLIKAARSCTDDLNAAAYIIEILRADSNLELAKINLENIKADIDALEEQVQKNFKNSVWTA